MLWPDAAVAKASLGHALLVSPSAPFLMGDDVTATAVGLACLAPAADVRARIKNDVILEMAINEVTATLYVFVDTHDPHTAVSYSSELYSVAWDLANAADKPQLEITIVAPPASPLSWDDLFRLPQLNVVYGDVASAAEDTKWLPRDHLLPVLYRSPAARLRVAFQPGVTFFEDDEQGLPSRPIAVVNGTFDHLHNGHRKLLALATSACTERLVVGITASQELLDAKPLAHLIEPLETRKRKVLDFVASINSTLHVEFVDVCDALGPAANSEDIRLIVVASTGDLKTIKARHAWRSTLHHGYQFVRLVRRTERSTLSSRRVRERIAAKSET